MSVVTKNGDQGYTGRFGGIRIPKDSISVAANGDIDELNSAIGLLSAREDISNTVLSSLYAIQELCFVIGSEIATPQDASEEIQEHIPRVSEKDLAWIEAQISELEGYVSQQKGFILPGGCPASAMCFWIRSVCRRAERSAVSMGKTQDIDGLVLQILNRMSDYFYVLARFLNSVEGVGEQKWKGANGKETLH